MRVSLFILGVFVAVVCIKNPLKRKTVPGASITMAMATVVRSAVTQHCNNAWLTGSGVAPVRPVHTRRRRQNHVRQPGSGGAER